MSNGKNIEVRIAATGGSEAAAEVRKVESAVDGLGTSSGDAASGIDELKKQMQETIDRARAATEGLDEAAESAGGLEEEVGKISNAQQAQVLSQLAGNVGKLGAEFQSVAKDVEKFDAELAATLDKAGKGLETLAGGLSSVALGFAAGGPIGAAAAALVVAIQAVGQAWVQSKIAAAEATQEEIAAMQAVAGATRDAELAAIQRNNALADAEVTAALAAQNAGIKDQAAAVKDVIASERELRQMRNEALDAVDKARLAEIDLAEARGEITPAQATGQRRDVEDTAAGRAENDRRQRAREEAVIAGRDAAAKTEAAAKAAAAAQEAERARAEAERKVKEKEVIASRAAANDESLFMGEEDYQKNLELYTKIEQIGSGSQIARARSILEASKDKILARIAGELEQAASDLEGKSEVAGTRSNAAGQAAQAAADARANANSKTATADRTDATVSVVAAQRARARELTEQAEARRAFDAAKRRQDEQALEARRDAARARLDALAKDAGGKFGIAADRGDARGVDPQVVDTLRSASNKLADGTNENEVTKLAQQIESSIGEMSGATAGALSGLVSAMQSQSAEIKALEAQIKDLRNK